MESSQLQLETTTKQISVTNQIKVVKNAVILAAGKSSRFRENGVKKPKVLLPIGGLRLLERSVLTLKEAGVEHFRITVGAYRDEIVPALKSLARLKNIDIEYVVCEDYELGNGVSFGAGAAGFDEPFLLTMSDHIFSPGTILDFVEKTNSEPSLPSLACDGNLANVFDMDDATKVDSKSGFINNIGKEIEKYDLVDTGLFYFPAGYGRKVADKVAEGARSVSDVIQHFIDESGVRAVALDNPMWQDVDNPSMKAEAERRLMKTLIHPNDGWVSRNINRIISTRITFLFAKWGLSPNLVTTGIFLLTMAGAFLAASGHYWQIVAGALIFQIASILDGCDGELARLTLRSTHFGSWYGKLTGNLRYVLFFEALGFSAWRDSGSQVYLIAMILLGALAIYMLTQMATFAFRQKGATHELLKRPPQTPVQPQVLNNFFSVLRELNKQDVTAFLTFILSIVFLYQAMFWVALLATTFSAIMISRSVRAASVAETGANLFEKIDPIFFYLIGVGILCLLIFNMDLSVVSESLAAAGNRVFLVFSIAILWILANTMCIRTLVQRKVSFTDLLFNQMVGDAYSTIIPMAGLGGEPFKLKHLTNWLDWHTASRALVIDRFIHATSGMLFASTTTFVTLAFVSIDQTFRVPMIIAAGVFGLMSAGVIWLALSTAPSKIAGYFLKKFRVVEEYRSEPIPPARFFLAFSFKFLGRVFNLIEIYAIFYILGFNPGVIELIAVAGMIAISATVFFIIPQGLGVNEAGISTALAFLGYTASLGITFGLIRRARMIFWALFGMALHLTVSVVKKLALSRASA